MPVVLWPFAVVLGALVGSVVNLLVWRVPRAGSMVLSSRRCTGRGHAIRALDAIPVVSWLLLRGRCRGCGARIPARYPLVELGGAAAFAGVLAWWAPSAAGSATASAVLGLVAFLYLAAVSIALALIDIDVQRLPNAIVLPSYVVVITLLAAASVLDDRPGTLIRAAIGGAGLFVLYLLFALVSPAGMGFGDVKLAGVLGFALAWLGWGPLAVGAIAPFVLGGVFGMVLLIARRAGRTTRIPFGPWMLGGAWVGAVAGESLTVGYLSSFGLALGSAA